MGGNADFKTNVYDNSTFDERLKKIIIKVIDVSYGMEQGLNQTIDQS
jgi:peptide chain release factor subunit 1